jgi:hypothetical protein
VLAACVVFVPAAAVGTVGVPVNEGEARGATVTPTAEEGTAALAVDCAAPSAAIAAAASRAVPAVVPINGAVVGVPLVGMPVTTTLEPVTEVTPPRVEAPGFGRREGERRHS